MMLQVMDSYTETRKLYERLGGEYLSWLLVRLYKPQLQIFVNQASRVINCPAITTTAGPSAEVIHRQATEKDVPSLLRLIQVVML